MAVLEPSVSAELRRKLARLSPELLRPAREIHLAAAPARLDVMGGISDYSGGLVLEQTLGPTARAAVQIRDDTRLVAFSFQAAEQGWSPTVAIDLGDFYAGRRLKSYRQVARLFSGPNRWAAYVLGAFFALVKEGKVRRWPSGATVVVDSDIPMGAGVASSGALEVAAMHAIAAAFGIQLGPLELALLCQITENRLAGAPCGVMDQVTAALGRPQHLLALLCQPHQVQGHHLLPDDLIAVGLDSAVKHAVGGRRYTRARVGAFMALKIITTQAGAGAYGGYLCNITPEEFRRRWWDVLPPKMRGADFLNQYGDTDDSATQVDPDEVYSVRASAMYPIYENARVRRFIELIGRYRETGDERSLIKAGRLMYAAHWGYRSLVGLGSRETDLIMRLVRKRGPARGLYGAKTSGGGSGGTMAILARRDAIGEVEAVAHEYRQATGLQPQLIGGSAPGSFVRGAETIVLQASRRGR